MRAVSAWAGDAGSVWRLALRRGDFLRWTFLFAAALAASGPLQAQQPGLPASAAAPGLSASAAVEGPAASLAPAEGKAPAVTAVTNPPRGFGHVLGDVFTQRVLLEHQGRALEPTALPPIDRVGLWLERRGLRRETDADGRPWLAIDYQVINAPRAITAIKLPGFTLATREGTALAVAPWPLSIGPLLGPRVDTMVDPMVDVQAGPPSSSSAAAAPGAAPLLQPDREVPLTATRPIERRLAQSLAALAAVLAAWAAWWSWRQWRESHRLPFARAWRRLRSADAAEGRDPAAWLALHQALNETAGRVVHAATLPRLLQEAPHLQPLSEPLWAFFRASAARFFGAAGAAPFPPFPLRELGRSLRDAERRHRR